jgi:hypothetical protein
MKDDFARRSVNWYELDRLVDGQLNRAEYRELLRQIEKDPEGWRQCALAFLQHQALGQELGQIHAPASGPYPESPLPAPSAGKLDPGNTAPIGRLPATLRQNLMMSLKLVAGIAAALMVGVTLGVIVRPVPDLEFPNPRGTRGDAFQQEVAAPLGPDQQAADAFGAGTHPYGFSPRRSSSRYGESRDNPIDQDYYLRGKCPNQVQQGKRR